MPLVKKIIVHSLPGQRFVRGQRRLGATVSPDIQPRLCKSFFASILPLPVIRYAYYVFLFALPFEERIGGLSLLGMILAGLTVFQPKLFVHRPAKAFWCFVIYLFVVATSGLIVVLDAWQDIELKSALITQLFRLFQLVVFFFIAYRLMMFEFIAKQSLSILALSCVLLAVLQMGGVIATEAHGRVTVYDFNPNVVALLLSVAFLCLLGLTHGGKDTSIKLRLLVWLGAAVLLIAIVRTGSRGGQLALALGIVALIFKPISMPQKVKTAFILGIVIVAMGWASYQINAVRERWERTYYEGEVSSRDVLFPIAWEMFLERPLVGWGPVNHYYEMNARTGDPDGGDPHNLYLWLLKETGLLGAAPFLIGLWACWRSAWKARGSSHGNLPLALLLLVLAHNLKGTYLFFKIFWLVLGYALASESYAITRSAVNWRCVSSRNAIVGRAIP